MLFRCPTSLVLGPRRPHKDKDPAKHDLWYAPCLGPQYVRSLVPNTMKSMAFGTRNLKYWVLGPSGLEFHA